MVCGMHFLKAGEDQQVLPNIGAEGVILLRRLMDQQASCRRCAWLRGKMKPATAREA
jgi:hypothetical protein